RMVEVGTTNRTRAADYEDALTARTAALLRVHTSNYTVSGFTETVSLREMEEIARRHDLMLIDDLGSGAIEPIAGEPTVADSVAHVRRRAAMWSVKLQERGVDVRLVDDESAVGGGSVPGHGLPTVLLALGGPASRIATALRNGEPPVIARIEDGACCIDPRTVL